MKIEEIRSKTDSELEFDLKGLKKELFDLRFKAAIESVGNTSSPVERSRANQLQSP